MPLTARCHSLRPERHSGWWPSSSFPRGEVLGPFPGDRPLRGLGGTGTQGGAPGRAGRGPLPEGDPRERPQPHRAGIHLPGDEARGAGGGSPARVRLRGARSRPALVPHRGAGAAGAALPRDRPPPRRRDPPGRSGGPGDAVLPRPASPERGGGPGVPGLPRPARARRGRGRRPGDRLRRGFGAPGGGGRASRAGARRRGARRGGAGYRSGPRRPGARRRRAPRQDAGPRARPRRRGIRPGALRRMPPPSKPW